MKSKTFYLSLLVSIFFTRSSDAQNIPACITALEKPGTFGSKLKFERAIILPDKRVVYLFTLSRPPRCMDCSSGTVYYDSTCKSVASFTMGRTANAFIAPGYSPKDFREASNQLYLNRLKVTAPLPDCITYLSTRGDSLKNAGVVRIDEYAMAGGRYFFVEKTTASNKNCNDCATAQTFYDTTCSKPVSFSIGGFAGIVAPAGFTKKDYQERKYIRSVWSLVRHNSTTTNSANSTAANPFPKPVSFNVTSIGDSNFLSVKVNDELKISTADGLYHYRKGQLINRYKIIPKQITQRRVNPCLMAPCPVSASEKIVYYLEPIKRYLHIQETGAGGWLYISKSPFPHDNGKSLSFKDQDWRWLYKMDKK